MLVIKKQGIKIFAKELAKNRTVFLPMKREDGEHVFAEATDGAEIDLDYTTTILPAKEFFLPAIEDIFVFDKKTNKLKAEEKPKEIILFINGRDAEALVQLDEIMKKPNEDYFYSQKRKSATIIAVINDASSALPSYGIDLIFEKMNAEEYKAHALTAKGKRLTENKLFYETKDMKSEIQPREKPMEKLRQILLDPELLADAIEWSWKNETEFWDKLAEKCVECGICAYVCPLCYCFSMEDSCKLDGKTCVKTRKWAACTLPEFAKISGGYNFHKIKQRNYNWYYHKFVRGYREYGKSLCVACGRCQKYCPARIDIEQVLTERVNNYKQKNP